MRTLLVAVGDVHGRYDKLDKLTAETHEYMDARRLFFGVNWNFLFIGDYIDRGPDSKGVVETIRRMQAEGVCLKGNHEQIAIDRGVPDELSTLDSYGGAVEALAPGSLYQNHIDWFRELPNYHETRLHFFVHAGIHPGSKLEEQKRPENQVQFLWIRGAFLTAQEPFEKYIVHGHSAIDAAEAEVHANRCNLDTGAGYGRALSAAVFDLDRKRPIHRISV